MPLDASLGLAPADLAKEVAKYDRLILKFPHARADRKYRLDLPNGPLTVSGVSLAVGIDLTPYASTLLPQAKEIASAVHTIRSTLTDSWLTSIGHKRPGMAQGRSTEEAERYAADLQEKVRALAKPTIVTLTLTAVD